jgi:hypothetical protein
MVFLFNQPKSKSLISFIKDKINSTIEISKNKSGWTLYIMTCYITKNGLELLFANISEILQQNNINKIEILADKKEWAKLFYFQEKGLLKHLTETFRVSEKLNINIKPVDCRSKLFHAKSYALIHDSEQEGFVITASANLTDNGLKDNLEFCNFSSDIASIKGYICLLQDIKEKFTLSPESEKELQDLAEAYTILSMGTFYTKKLEIETRCPLFLTQKGQKERSGKNIGGDKAIKEETKKTISYRLVDYITIKSLLPAIIPPTVISNYSIDTPVGRWIPNSVSEFITERINKYKEAYISFMLSEYLNDEFFKSEKDYYSKTIETELQNKGYMTFSEVENEDNSYRNDDFKKQFIEEYINKLEKMTNLHFPKQDDQSILNIFWNYKKDIDIEMLPTNTVILILSSMNQEIEKQSDVSKVKKKNSNRRTRDLNVLKTKVKQIGIELKDKNIDFYDYKLFNKFAEEQCHRLNEIIDSLDKNNAFSAVISSNQEYGKFEIIFDCIVKNIERNNFGFVDKIIYCSRNDISIKYLPRNNIELLHKIDKKKVISQDIDNMSKLST